MRLNASMAGDRPLLQRVFLEEQGVPRASSRNASGLALLGGELTYPSKGAFLMQEIYRYNNAYNLRLSAESAGALAFAAIAELANCQTARSPQNS